jgi:tRNA A-37 threonylcarbamoyl transferase component Bud32
MRPTKVVCLAVWFFLLCISVHAQEAGIHKVTIATSPEQVEVFLDVSGRRRYEKFLGNSDSPILLDLRELQGASGFTLVLRRQGYFDKRERLSMDYFQATDKYPEAGKIRLTPESWAVPVMDFLEAKWPVVVTLGLVMGVLLGVGLKRRRKALDRAIHLERLAENAVVGDPLLQTVLEKWRLVQVLGHGASATVYLAVPDDTLDESKKVAIKIFNEGTVESEEFQTRFRREAQVYQSLSHPSIVRLLDWGQQGDLFYLVMEHVDGKPIQGCKVTESEMEREVLERLSQLAAGLGHAHDSGIIHRDVKPGNVLVTDAGKVKLLDFGLAREVLSSFTKTGQALGTPLYMAPEQIAGALVDHRCDQYALGVLAYELVTGEKTFETEENKVAPILFQQVNQDPESVRERGASVSEKTEQLIQRLMTREPRDRFTNMKEVEKALRGCIESLG